MLRPSGDHSYANTPSDAVVDARGAVPDSPTANTCGRPPATPMSETVAPSGDQRSCGRGTGVLKMCTASPRPTGGPPAAGTTNSAASWSFFASDGVETTD